jgi:hypothetical protein
LPSRRKRLSVPYPSADSCRRRTSGFWSCCNFSSFRSLIEPRPSGAVSSDNTATRAEPDTPQQAAPCPFTLPLTVDAIEGPRREKGSLCLSANWCRRRKSSFQLRRVRDTEHRPSERPWAMAHARAMKMCILWRAPPGVPRRQSCRRSSPPQCVTPCFRWSVNSGNTALPGEPDTQH